MATSRRLTVELSGARADVLSLALYLSRVRSSEVLGVTAATASGWQRIQSRCPFGDHLLTLPNAAVFELESLCQRVGRDTNGECRNDSLSIKCSHIRQFGFVNFATVTNTCRIRMADSSPLQWSIRQPV